ncbi:Dehydrogenase reductase SDR member 7B [Perkinsus chesapeaki]|uniref:Dehydrogenase reductase SDR member 7B n=1 Tax=Perkinsus chesapeaki TaxID=330153 RepID=A0A7J6MPA1_PERCH|nr:Dehydrogenase reductase SDR member 7B [Perkinsus chesapeaki]
MADKCQYMHVHKKVDTPVCESFEKIGFCEKGAKCKKLHYTAPVRQIKRDSPEGSANEKKADAPVKKKKKTLSKEEIERQLDEEGMRAWEAGGLMKVMIYFDGKAIWVVGASSGLGRAIARLLIQEAKPRVLVVSARREGRLEELKDLAAAVTGVNPSVDVHIVPVDLARSTDRQLADTAAKVESLCGDEGVDVLFNCAGVGYRGTALDTSMEVLREHMQVNFFGQVAIAKGLLPEWFKSAHSRKYTPHLIQVSSVQGKFGQGGRSAYAAAKHAQLGYFDSLRAELEAAGAGRVTMCLPGYINSEHSENAMLDDGTKCGVHDVNAASGSSPEYVAKDIMSKAALGRREVVTSQASGKVGILARTVVPEMFLEKMARRYSRKAGYPSPPPSTGMLAPIICITAVVATTLWFLFL